MKVRFLFICTMLCSWMATIAAPEIKWIETVHDFGTFDEDMGNVRCNIPFVNIGKEDVVIVNVRTSCGCTASDYPIKPIAPGDTASVTVIYNPKGRPGKFSKDVYVYINSEQERHVLKIEGNVIGASNTIRSKFPISVGNFKIDSSIIPFGEINKGRAKSAFINGYNQSNDSIKIAWKNVPTFITVSSVPEIVPPGGLATISVYFDSSKDDEWGLSKSSFSLIEKSIKNGAENAQVIELIAIVNESFANLSEKERANAPIIKISDEKIDCGIITPEKSKITKSFTITNEGKKPLIIRRIYTLDKGITVEIPKNELKKNQSTTITVTIDSTQIDSKILNAKLSILTNAPLKPTTTIRIVGEIKK